MRRSLFIVLAVFFVFYMFGCAKREQAQEETLDPMSMEAMSSVSITEPPQAKPAQALEPLPPAGPYKPSNREIQLALKNANLYTGPIDGIIGPKTKKAIEEFQKTNGLKADGKVGPKTWAILGSYLNPPQQTAAPAKTR